MKPIGDESWCLRLEEAVLEGRFLEDPGFWRPHVEQCSTCREVVEGVFLLRDSIGRARMDDDLTETAPLDGDRVIAGALGRHRAERRRQVVLWSLGGALVLVLGAGAMLLVRRGVDSDCPRPPQEAARAGERAADGVAGYAGELFRRVFPLEGPTRDTLLQEDPALRAEYLRALDHPSSLVRRVAISALTFSKIPIDAARLTHVLTTWDETLDGPVVVASAGPSERQVAEALDARRTATLVDVLLAVEVQALRGGERVPSASVRPYLLHAEGEVRQAALAALGADPTLDVASEAERLLASDPVLAVRDEAARQVLRRRGARGAEQIVALLKAKPDAAMEQKQVVPLGQFPAGIAFARERADDPATPLPLALLHASVIARRGERAAALRLIPRAVADGDMEALHRAASLAAELDARELRAPFQERWRRDHGPWCAARVPSRDYLALALARWDEASGDAHRLALALELLEGLDDLHLPPLRDLLGRLAAAAGTETGARARALLGRPVVR